MLLCLLIFFLLPIACMAAFTAVLVHQRRPLLQARPFRAGTTQGRAAMQT